MLSAHSPGDARRGTILGGWLKLTPLFVFVVPGVLARALVLQGAIDLPNSDAALPTMIATLLPAGLRGLVVAGLLAALMSSLSSVFNSCSTLVTWDVYKKLRPDTPDEQLVRVGQASTVVLVLLGLAWIPMMQLISGQLYQYLQSVQGYISPPIAAVFLLGLFVPRVNATGAVAALVAGFTVGAARLVLELNTPSLSGPLLAFAQINFLHFAFALFVLSVLVGLLASLTTPAPPRESRQNLSFAHTSSAPKSHSRWHRWDQLASIGLLLAVATLWIWLR